MQVNQKHENNVLTGMASILDQRDEKIRELSVSDSDRDSRVVKTLERKIHQMQRASLGQESLIANLKNEIERRNVVIDWLKFEKEDLEREILRCESERAKFGGCIADSDDQIPYRLSVVDDKKARRVLKLSEYLCDEGKRRDICSALL
jgi:hypothetical protein